MSTAHTVVEVRDLRKRYRLGVIGGATLGDELKVLLARLRGRPNPLVPLDGGMDAQREGEHFWALRGVSFDVQEGEILGIIGKNGAGKSTLLKLLSRITTPTEGTARMKGLVSSLLEDGTGFATVRACRDGVKIGPIVAPDHSAALVLARAALGVLPAERAVIDLPASNRALADVLERLGFVETFATARMYRGAAPTASQSLQAISTMELG